MKINRVLASIFFLLFCAAGLAQDVRIVSLAPALTEIVCFLGKEELLVGRTAACDYPASVKNIASVGRFGTPEIERIIALKPTLVIGNDLMNMNIVRKLRELGITVEVRQINSPEDYICWLDFLAEKLACHDRVSAEKSRINSQLAELKKFPAQNKHILWVVNAQPLMAAGGGTLPDKVINLMQCQNSVGAVKNYFYCSQEQLLRIRIDLVIYAVPGSPNPRRGVWKHLPAVRQGKVVKNIADSAVMRPGPRFLEEVIKLRKTVEIL